MYIEDQVTSFLVGVIRARLISDLQSGIGGIGAWTTAVLCVKSRNMLSDSGVGDTLLKAVEAKKPDSIIRTRALEARKI